MSSRGLLCLESHSGKQEPLSSVATWGILALCSSEKARGTLETRELRAWWQLWPAQSPATWRKAAPLFGLREALHPRQLGLAVTFHALKSQKGKEKGALQKRLACQAQISLCFCAENKHRCEG